MIDQTREEKRIYTKTKKKKKGDHNMVTNHKNNIVLRAQTRFTQHDFAHFSCITSNKNNTQKQKDNEENIKN